MLGERLSPETDSLLRGVSTATLATLLFRRGFRTRVMTGVRPVRPDLKLVGVARTLRYIPMREDLDRVESFRDPENAQRKAVELIRPGEVLVIDARGEQTAGTIGSILATRIKQRGGAGVVSDGPFRDLEGIRVLDLPAYCSGSHANTNLTVHHPADMDVPIGCGGVAVFPGDVLVGDGDGVLVIPRALADELAAEAAEQERQERFILRKIESGSSIVGVYPMNEATRAEYERWRAAGEDEHQGTESTGPE